MHLLDEVGRARVRKAARVVGHLAVHPTEARRLPAWFRHRTASPLDLAEPWWPYEARAFVESRLSSTDTVFEFGGGGSTLWLQARVKRTVCVEHHASWYERLAETVGASVDLRLVAPDDDGQIRSDVETAHFFDRYVESVRDEPIGSLDLVIVDGRARVDCALNSMDRIRPGGMLLLDDSDRPRYRAVHDAMVGWEPHHFRGLKPAAPTIAQTSVWVKAADQS